MWHCCSFVKAAGLSACPLRCRSIRSLLKGRGAHCGPQQNSCLSFTLRLFVHQQGRTSCLHSAKKLVLLLHMLRVKLWSLLVLSESSSLAELLEKGSWTPLAAVIHGWSHPGVTYKQQTASQLQHLTEYICVLPVSTCRSRVHAAHHAGNYQSQVRHWQYQGHRLSLLDMTSACHASFKECS